MIAVRELRAGDRPGLVGMARAMQQESPIYSPYPFEAELVARWADQCLGSDDWLCLVAEQDGQLIGFIAACCMPMLFSPTRCVDDLGFYVRPEWRGTTAAVRLIRQLETWAKAKGAALIRMGITTGTNPEAASRFLTRFGYQQTGLVLTHAI